MTGPPSTLGSPSTPGSPSTSGDPRVSIGPPAIRFPSIDTLSRELAVDIAESLTAAIAARGTATLIVSGGRSPVKLFENLRIQPVDWRRVSISLADERWVDPSDDASNERLVRDCLVKDGAADACFVGFKTDAETPELGAAASWQALAGMRRPFDMVVLGMGDDGHTASLFPNSPNLHTALDVAMPAGCVAMRAPNAPQQRISLNLAALLDSRRIIVLATGGAKWQTYLAAVGPGAADEMPIRAVLRQRAVPANLYWSP